MTAVTAAMVKELREKTGAGMMDCKSALKESDGSVEGAIEVLRKKGLKDLDKRSGKTAAEGVIGVYVHPGDQVVALVELNCETDFVGRGDEFRQVARDIAMHVAAMKPKYLSVEEVPADTLEKEKEIISETLSEDQLKKAGDKIIEGKLNKFFDDTVLLRQEFVKEVPEAKSVQDVVEKLAIKVGEKVSIRRFARFQVGEGIEKVQADFVSEVAAMTGNN